MRSDEDSMSRQETLPIFEADWTAKPVPEHAALRNLKISFNSIGLQLGGGNRITIELARRLSERGHDVQINAIAQNGDTDWFGDLGKVKFNLHFPSKASRLLNQKILRRSFRDVQTELLSDILSDTDCDVSIATFCLTAEPTAKSMADRKFYLVQNYEPAFFTDPVFIRRAEESYMLPLERLCVSKWLQQKVGGMYIGDAVNTEVFNPKNGFEEKEPNSVLYLYRNLPWKGDQLALKTLEQLHHLNPQAKVHVVSKEKLDNLSFPYILHTNVQDAELAKLYSKARVLLYTSKFEGFGLPPLEALSCGTNVVSTPFEGNEYLVDRENCYMAKNKTSLAQRIQELMNNDELAQRQLEIGRKTAQNYSFNTMVNRMLAAFGA